MIQSIDNQIPKRQDKQLLLEQGRLLTEIRYGVT